jgi:DedD protein
MSLLHQDDDLEHEAPERELTLSTGAIFGIFAGLVLLCALFFGFGYMVRGRQTPPPILASVPVETSASSSSTNFNSFKPAAGSPTGSTQPGTRAALAPVFPEPTVASPAGTETAPIPQPAPVRHAATAAVPPEAAPLVHPVPPPASTRPVAAPAAQPTLMPTGSFIVQVAAVSHEEDAVLLVNALKAKGYPAAARNEAQDKLLHIQIGPYATRQAADAVKQRLSADGYNNPIVK